MVAIKFSMAEYCEYISSDSASRLFTPNRDFNCPQEKQKPRNYSEDVNLNNLPNGTLVFLNGDRWFYKMKITDGEKGKIADIWLNPKGDGLRGLVENIGSFEREGEGWIFERGIIKRKAQLIFMPYFSYNNQNGKMHVKTPNNWAMYCGLNITNIQKPE